MKTNKRLNERELSELTQYRIHTESLARQLVPKPATYYFDDTGSIWVRHKRDPLTYRPVLPDVLAFRIIDTGSDLLCKGSVLKVFTLTDINDNSYEVYFECDIHYTADLILNIMRITLLDEFIITVKNCNF